MVYAYKETLEEYAKSMCLCPSEYVEFVYHLEGKVSKQRFDELKGQFERLDKRPSFDFLTRAERRAIEAAIGAKDVENNMSNGMNYIARYCLNHGKTKLWFEGHLEDNGYCTTLLTPYGKRDGKFLDLSKCVTSKWW